MTKQGGFAIVNLLGSQGRQRKRGGETLLFFADPGAGSMAQKNRLPAAHPQKEITLDESADHSVRQGLFLFYLSI